FVRRNTEKLPRITLVQGLEVTVRIRPTGGHVALPSGARGNTPFVALVGTAFLPESQNQSATFRGWRNESVELQWVLSGEDEGTESSTLCGA
ncbi:MAG: hypothetical protein WCK05_14190, partial [Planctomycetota bacterium]